MKVVLSRVDGVFVREASARENAMSMEQLQQQTEALESSIDTYQAEIEQLQERVGSLSDEQRERLESLCIKMVDLWLLRRRQFVSLLDTICESAETTPEALKEQVGFLWDTDEGLDRKKAKHRADAARSLQWQRSASRPCKAMKLAS